MVVGAVPTLSEAGLDQYQYGSCWNDSEVEGVEDGDVSMALPCPS